ncbi:MAG: NAD(P)/FAD-dependent oxidoreductase [Pseudomonadota bacterium]|nr:NAD(P)/FAD-dependent oxidoreductase [Pseudomonadota bacterium]
MATPYDVIIVGGRPAGASLAARLGQQGRRVLVLERAELPSLPNVPSCPTLHMGTLKLLDELGIDEAAYGKDAVRFEQIAVQFGAWFTSRFSFPTVHGRTFGYSIERAPFDLTLWEHLARYPSVTRRRFTVTALVKDAAGAVIGVQGHGPRSGEGESGEGERGEDERIEAPWVVGADGRFSFVAREAGAKVVEEAAEKVSTVYFTEWEGLAPLAPGMAPLLHIYTTGRGLNVLMFPLPGNRTTLCLHQRADRVDIQGDAEAYYERTLRGIPAIAARLQDARRVGRVIGLKRVGNGYREAGGRGWLLVGDALHYKDPVDGQGIYDALIETRILAEELERWFAGGVPVDAVAPAYERRTRQTTHPMYRATVKRIADELYTEPPVPIIRTLIRWMLHDPVYQARFLRFLGRDLDPATWMPPGVVAGIVARGIWSDVRRLFGRPSPAIPGPVAGT